MFRRRFLQSTAAVATTLASDLKALADTSTTSTSSNSQHPFSYQILKVRAKRLAGSPYQPPSEQLPSVLADISWDQWEAIRFRDERALWAKENLRFQIKLFHLGLAVRTPVKLFTVDQGSVQEVLYDPAWFDFSKSGVDVQKLPRILGFAGFRLCFHTDWIRDIAAFQNHSYFRAVDGEKQYGLSHRGLAIDCGLASPEEFPYFTEYYLEKPSATSDRLNAYALLDSPSIAGAYRFEISVSESVTMDIDATLFARKQIERLGVAPGTSMFLCGSNDRRVGLDLRPQIHDSDGLQLATGAGQDIWRPLANPAVVRVNAFSDRNPLGFGLMQRDHNFDHYQDDGAFYDRRPSAWVEPRGQWGNGSVIVVELPAPTEAVDNIVAFWTPAEKPQPGQQLQYGYRLYWCRECPRPSLLATVQATRTGIGGLVAGPRTHFSWRFEVDFHGKELASLSQQKGIVPVISASRGQIELSSARPLNAISGWRALFDLKLTDDSVGPIDIQLFLALDGKPLTETWVYQYSPPTPEKRRAMIAEA
jgi:periplasmic glucans biosynthesis protein